MTELEKNIQQVLTDHSAGREPSHALKEHIFQQITATSHPQHMSMGLRLPVAIAVLLSIMSVHLVAS